MGENEPEVKKPRKKPAKDANKPKIAAAGRMMSEMAAALKGMAPSGSRLLVDMPLDEGEVRLTLVDRGRRVSVWGADMEKAMEALLLKAELDRSTG